MEMLAVPPVPGYRYHGADQLTARVYLEFYCIYGSKLYWY